MTRGESHAAIARVRKVADLARSGDLFPEDVPRGWRKQYCRAGDLLEVCRLAEKGLLLEDMGRPGYGKDTSERQDGGDEDGE